MNCGTNEFDILNNWLGWGDPHGGVWFLGVEAGGEWKCDTESELRDRRRIIQALKDLDYSSYIDVIARDADDDGQGMNFPIATVTAKIASALGHGINGWREYRANSLWIDGGGVFNANMLPIGKKNLYEWPVGYKSLFGFTQKEYEENVEQILSVRAAKFEALTKRFRPSAIVCFGKSHWSYFKKFLSLDVNDMKNMTDQNCLVYESRRVILTRHFSNGMPDNTVKKIVSQLLGWGITLP